MTGLLDDGLLLGCDHAAMIHRGYQGDPPLPFHLFHHFFRITPGSLDGYAYGPLQSSYFSHPNPKILMAFDPRVSHGSPCEPEKMRRFYPKPTESDGSGRKDLGLSVLKSAQDGGTQHVPFRLFIPRFSGLSKPKV